MASSNKLAQLMNRSLETKFGIYENMAEKVGQRPVIFTDRAEIWSTDTNPIIIVGHPFPSVTATSDNPEPSDLTRGMMEYFRRNLPKAKNEEGHPLNLILFQFQVRGITEVHVVFSRCERSAEDIPAEIYLKKLDPTEVLTRECSTDESDSEKSSKTSVSMVLAPGEIVIARPASISGATCLVGVTTMSDQVPDIGPIESRLGPAICENLEEKLELFLVYISEGVQGMMFTNVPGLWNHKIPRMIVAKHPMPRIPDDYDHERFDIEKDMLEYVKHVAKQYCEPFNAYSRKFGDGHFADVHLMFVLPQEVEIKIRTSTDD